MGLNMKKKIICKTMQPENPSMLLDGQLKKRVSDSLIKNAYVNISAFKSISYSHDYHQMLEPQT